MRLVLVWLAVLSPFSVQAEEQLLLEVCVDASDTEERTTALLDQLVLTARLLPSLRQGCRHQPGVGLRSYFEKRGQVFFVVESPQGRVLDRAVPWLVSDVAPLATLQAKGLLSKFSVVVEGLLAEYRSIELTPPPRPQPVRQEIEVRSHTDGSHQEHEVSPAETGEADAGPEGPDTAEEPVAEQPVESLAGGRRSLEQASEEVEGNDQATTPPPAGRISLPVGVGIGAGARWRSPGILGAELSLRVQLPWAFARLGWQPATPWRFKGRPVDVDGVSIAAGWRPRVWQTEKVGVNAEVCALAELLSLRRKDVEGAGRHWLWDFELAGGVEVSYRLIPQLEISSGVVGIWSPTARKVGIPDGPIAVVNRGGLRVEVSASWEM